MAYSFADVYRPLRLLFRINGLALGCGFGALLLLASPQRLMRLGILTVDAGWITRLAGALLLVLGAYFLLAAAQPHIDIPALVTSLLAHGLSAIVLLIAYLQRDLAGLNWFGQLGLIVVVILCLAGALLPLRYLRAEYRAY